MPLLVQSGVNAAVRIPFRCSLSSRHRRALGKMQLGRAGNLGKGVLHWSRIALLEGWHRHHVLPRSSLSMPQLGALAAQLRRDGFLYECFRQNGMYLPSRIDVAQRHRLPLHRGSHPRYSRMVTHELLNIQDFVLGRDDADARSMVEYLVADLKAELSAIDDIEAIKLSARTPFASGMRESSHHSRTETALRRATRGAGPRR